MSIFSSCFGYAQINIKDNNKKQNLEKFTKHTLSPGLIMAGYQGWFNTADDGAERGWRHLAKEGKFAPGHSSVDLWPDMSEYTKQYNTDFRYQDGSVATMFSSYDQSTVELHFKWMKDYKIDGVFMQRFVNEIKSPSGKRHFDNVLQSATKAALKFDRTIAIMYDMSGMNATGAEVIIEDWKKLMTQYGYNKRSKYPNYLFNNGKPLVAIWGVGFNDKRNYNLDDVQRIIQFLKSDEGGNCSVLLGVPTYWREQGNDCVKDEKMHQIIQMADVVHPWFVARFKEEGYEKFKPIIGKDKEWCDAHNLKYMPVVFPGFSWNNLYPDSKNSFIARNHGEFFWKQLHGAISQGAEMIYVAMFDEIDEGTAIFKTAKNVPVGQSKFIAVDADLQSDYYLWLTGKAGEILKKKSELPQERPTQKSVSN
ncbi:xylosidase [Flavobacterium sp. FlaQc-47]|uniref:glycoside hydrolase family 71/99-like protein n=1 Tax=Flavobacterium sp. FlaQc-47 TaxID=3374180 RepID=UPI0037568456